MSDSVQYLKNLIKAFKVFRNYTSHNTYSPINLNDGDGVVNILLQDEYFQDLCKVYSPANRECLNYIFGPHAFEYLFLPKSQGYSDKYLERSTISFLSDPNHFTRKSDGDVLIDRLLTRIVFMKSESGVEDLEEYNE